MTNHIPVLLKEVIKILEPRRGIIIDATLGAGGHSKFILEKSKVSIIGLDQDGEALETAEENLKKFKDRVTLIRENFSNLQKVSEKLGVLGKVRGIILDLGISSLQLDGAERGFSFQKEGPLDMRMDRRQKITAYEIINSWPKDKIAAILRDYGEERFSRRLAKAITEERRKKKIETTTQLAELIKKNVPKKYAFSKIHPATRTFQALRIVVNDELSNLAKVLEDSESVLAGRGKIIVISFHSLEDRIVKRFFKEMASKSLFRILTKKPVTPSLEEIRSNPRSRSAKLRAAQKINNC